MPYLFDDFDLDIHKTISKYNVFNGPWSWSCDNPIQPCPAPPPTQQFASCQTCVFSCGGGCQTIGCPSAGGHSCNPPCALGFDN